MKSPDSIQKNTDELFEEHLPLNWLRVLAFTAVLIGTSGLFALTWAADPTPTPGAKFEPGQRVFSNPFAGAPGGKSPTFFDDEDEEDEEDIEFEDFPTRPPGGASAPSYGRPSNVNADLRGGDTGSKGTGSGTGGVITHNKSTPIQIDSETAEGSKEIVTDFNFPDADIMDIAKTLGKLTGKNFIFDKDVKGRVTIISNSPITVGDAWKAFLTALDMNNFALIPSGKYIRIARQRDARDKQLKTYTGEFSPNTDALITRLFPLKYLSAEEVARNFRNFMPPNSRIIPYEQTNTVIVTDTGANITKLSKLLDILDVEGYDAGIEVIPVKYASATELSKLIDTLIPGTHTASGPGGSARPFGMASKFSARRTKEGGIINTIISDERTNTLIVHANTKGADQVRELVTKLDQKLPVNAGGGKVRVIYLQFADAEAIASTLNNISQGTGGRATGGAGTGTGVNPVQASLFEGSIKIAPDKATNSLVITASATDFVTVQQVVNRLDIPRDEVYVETVIMEMAMNRDFNFSASVINPTNGIGFTPNTDLASFIANPLGQKGILLGFKSGGEKAYTIDGKTYNISSVQGLIKALQVNNMGNVLATPQILTLDNTEATFESAERIPVLTSTAVQGAVAQSTTKENVSLMIKIKPQINKLSNFVKLDVDTKMESISNRDLPTQLQALAIATTSRTAKTTIVVADSDTAVIGGLTRDVDSESVSKVPILGDIPLLGWLFRAKSTSIQKTNLLIFLTPHIVRQYDKVRSLLDKKLKERDDFIESAAGGTDRLRQYRDNIIRGLPDIKEITAQQPKVPTNSDEDEAAAPPVDSSQPFTGGRTVTPKKPAEPAPAESPVPQADSLPPATAPMEPPAQPPLGGSQ